MIKKYITIDEAANQLRVNKRAVMRLVKLKKIECLKPSPRKTYFTQEMIDNYANGI